MREEALRLYGETDPRREDDEGRDRSKLSIRQMRREPAPNERPRRRCGGDDQRGTDPQASVLVVHPRGDELPLYGSWSQRGHGKAVVA